MEKDSLMNRMISAKPNKDTIELETLILIFLKDGPLNRTQLYGLIFMFMQATKYSVRYHGELIDPQEVLKELEEDAHWELFNVRLKNGFHIIL
jgi:hypothetical protein